MALVANTIAFMLLGLLVGGLARFAQPGAPRLSVVWTAALGVAGIVLGALLGEALFGSPGLPLLAVLVSTVLLGWHYVVDVPAGIALAVAGLWAGGVMHEFLDDHRKPQPGPGETALGSTAR